MITIYYNNNPDFGCVIRPTPLVSISHNVIKNKLGTLGASYSITLTGTIIADEGSPIYLSNGNSATGPDGKFLQIGPNYNDTLDSYNRPNTESVEFGSKLASILTKQQAIRELFAIDGQKMEIQPITGDEPIIICYPSVDSINFEEGIYVDICNYTITLTAETLLDNSNKVFTEGRIGSVFSANPSTTDSYSTNADRKTEIELIEEFGGFVEDFNDTWSIEVDEANGQTPSELCPGSKIVPRSYRITRNMSATGRVRYIPDGNEVKRLEGWEQAKDFIKKKILYDSPAGYEQYPGYSLYNIFSKGFLDLPAAYRGFNHIRTENIDKAAGSYNVSDTWLLCSEDKAFENYNMSVNAGINSAFTQVSIDGTIKGLSSLPASGYAASGYAASSGCNIVNLNESPYDRALQKYYEISNSGQFGIGSNLYKRANNSVAHTLNSQPASISLGMNQFTGEITYNLQFDNRPLNVFDGVLSESIQVNDTYPGDVFAVIPVLGRATGPILQYIGGRTEYKRDLSIEIQLDYTDIGYNRDRDSLILRKPSLNEPIRSQLNNVIQQFSPQNEYGIRKYFINPPSESWSPKEGRYTINLSWIYELDT